jgi:hypothetical protein
VSWKGAWPSIELLNLERALDQVIELVDKPGRDQPDEVGRALSRFLVVRASGYIEQVSEDSCRCFIRSKAIPQVGSYGASWLGRGNSPTPEHLVELVRRFDPRWGDELTAFLQDHDELLWRELSLLVDRRHKIAHGLSEGITGRKALDLAGHAKTVGGWFVARFDPR